MENHRVQTICPIHRPVVLKKVLHKDVYDHFLCLTVALSILLDSCERRRVAYMDFAEQLLSYFEAKCEHIYTAAFLVYNIFSLKHLADDCRNYQCPLNDIRAFPFKNHLQVLKRLVRNAKNPVCQVANRLTEQETAGGNQKRQARGVGVLLLKMMEMDFFFSCTTKTLPLLKKNEMAVCCVT